MLLATPYLSNLFFKTTPHGDTVRHDTPRRRAGYKRD